MVQWHTTSGWITAILLVAGLVLWWGTGRGLARAAGRPLARVLRGIRALGLLVLVFLLMNLHLTWESGRTVPPTIAIYVDDSRSMQPFAGQTRSTVDTLEARLRQADIRYRLFRFGEEISPVRRSSDLNFSEAFTDLSLPVTHLQTTRRQEDIRGAVVISDGRQNTGILPQSLTQTGGVPVYSLFVGDSIVSPDIRVNRFLLPRVTYAGDSVQAEVRLSVQNLREPATVLLRLSQSAGLLGTEKVALSAGSYSRDIRRTVVLPSPGEYRVAAAVDTVPGEEEQSDNRAERQITVRPARYQVLVAARTPSYATRFLLQAIRGMEKFSAATYFQDLSDPAGLDSLLSAADILYVIGSPETGAGQPVTASAADSIRGVIYQEDTQGDMTGGRLTSAAAQWQETTVSLGDRKENPLVAVFPDPLQWTGLPPIWVDVRPNPGRKPARILLRSQSTRYPVISVGGESGPKTVFIRGAHLWRWQFVHPESRDQPALATENPYQSVLSQLFFWLLQQSASDRLQVWTEIRQGNTLQAEAQVFTTAMQPVTFARVWGEVMDSTGALEHRAGYTRTDNAYLFRTRIRTPGQYRLRTVVYTPDDTLEQQSPAFTIPPVDFENPGGPGNPESLRAMSARFSGRLLENAEAFPLDLAAGRPGIRFRRQHTFRMRHTYWLLGGLVLLFGVDWWMRRRNGLL